MEPDCEENKQRHLLGRHTPVGPTRAPPRAHIRARASDCVDAAGAQKTHRVNTSADSQQVDDLPPLARVFHYWKESARGAPARSEAQAAGSAVKSGRRRVGKGKPKVRECDAKLGPPLGSFTGARHRGHENPTARGRDEASIKVWRQEADGCSHGTCRAYRFPTSGAGSHGQGVNVFPVSGDYRGMRVKMKSKHSWRSAGGSHLQSDGSTRLHCHSVKESPPPASLEHILESSPL